MVVVRTAGSIPQPTFKPHLNKETIPSHRTPPHITSLHAAPPRHPTASCPRWPPAAGTCEGSTGAGACLAALSVFCRLGAPTRVYTVSSAPAQSQAGVSACRSRDWLVPGWSRAEQQCVVRDTQQMACGRQHQCTQCPCIMAAALGQPGAPHQAHLSAAPRSPAGRPDPLPRARERTHNCKGQPTSQVRGDAACKEVQCCMHLLMLAGVGTWQALPAAGTVGPGSRAPVTASAAARQQQQQQQPGAAARCS